MQSEVMAVNQGDVMHHLWDLCPEAWAVIKDDDAARDAVWEATLSELEDVVITYQFRGETAHDRRLREALVAKIRTKQELDRVQRCHEEACWAYDQIARDA